MTDFSKPWMHTASGTAINFLSLQPGDVNVDDIAHALAMQCRFNGHTRHFYSVAEHSVNVSYEVDQKYALAALLHDAGEAYIGDLITPVKRMFPEFSVLEDTIVSAVYRRYNIPLFDDAQNTEVKRADRVVCLQEGRALLRNNDLIRRGEFANDPDLVVRNPLRELHCLPPYSARQVFMQRFFELVEERARNQNV